MTGSVSTNVAASMWMGMNRCPDGIAVSGRTARGEEVFAQHISDRYLLAGIVKRYTASIAKDICVRLATLEVTAKTQQFTLSRKLDVDPASCG